MSTILDYICMVFFMSKKLSLFYKSFEKTIIVYLNFISEIINHLCNIELLVYTQPIAWIIGIINLQGSIFSKVNLLA